MKKVLLPKLDRLTERDKNGAPFAVWNDETIPCGKTAYCPVNLNECELQCDFGNILKRLADYEDTGRTPFGVEELKKKAGARK